MDSPIHVCVCVCVFMSEYNVQCHGAYEYLHVGSCLATKVFIGNLPAMERGWVIIK